MNDADARADTMHANGRHRDGCPLAQEMHAVLIGNGREPGFFERVRVLEWRFGIVALLMVAPLWAMAIMMALEKMSQ